MANCILFALLLMLILHMKHLIKAIILILVSACASSPRNVVIDYDQDARFSDYLTYYWSDEILSESVNQPLFYNSLIKKRIKSAIQLEMDGRGYELNEFDPDLVINAHMIVEEKTETRNYSSSPYRFYAPDNYKTINYKEGTLVIDLIDKERRQLVWQGYYKGSFVDAKTPEERSRSIRDAVSLIFQKYDYRANIR
jgi:hypothetical protein